MRNKHLQFVSKQAFTLLELIVAIALMDVIAVSLYASMHIGFTAKKNTQAAMIPFRSVLPVFETIRNDLICAMPPPAFWPELFWVKMLTMPPRRMPMF